MNKKKVLTKLEFCIRELRDIINFRKRIKRNDIKIVKDILIEIEDLITEKKIIKKSNKDELHFSKYRMIGGI